MQKRMVEMSGCGMSGCEVGWFVSRGYLFGGGRGGGEGWNYLKKVDIEEIMELVGIERVGIYRREGRKGGERTLLL